MAGADDLAKMVPGFEFLQTLMKTAGAALPGVPGVPGMSQWIAPTLDPEELEKRIQELKTVQFWLEQNAKLLGGTIQALEVQRMTLSTLKSMNLQLGDLRDALTINPPSSPVSSPVSAPVSAPAAAPARTPAPAAAAEPEAAPGAAASAAAAAPATTLAVDPLQWWGALTQQFTEIATKAVTDSAAAAAAVKTAAAPAPAPKPAPAPATSRKRRS